MKVTFINIADTPQFLELTKVSLLIALCLLISTTWKQDIVRLIRKGLGALSFMQQLIKFGLPLRAIVRPDNQSQTRSN